jgi:hypothetical protein
MQTRKKQKESVMYQHATSKPKYINPYVPQIKGCLKIPVDCIASYRKIDQGEYTGLTYINYFDFQDKNWNRVLTTWSVEDIVDATKGGV